MGTRQSASLRERDEPVERESPILKHDEKVAQAVLDILGKPQNLTGVKASMVWPNWYRVDVRVAKEKNGMIAVTKICDSFLVKYDSGKICGGDEINKKY